MRVQETHSLHPPSYAESCARASHRLLTLLTTISANLSILRRPDLLRTRKDYDEAVAAAETAAKRLRRALANLLALEETSSGPQARGCSEAEIEEIVGIQAANVRLRHPDLEIRIQTEVGTGGGTVPLGRRELETILENLLDNAVGFCDKPVPEIRILVRGLDSSARITVEDNGPGIGPDDQDRVFERFFQCESGTPRAAGVGLGLALVRSIANARGGGVSVRSAPGAGTAVTLEIPRPAG